MLRRSNLGHESAICVQEARHATDSKALVSIFGGVGHRRGHDDGRTERRVDRIDLGGKRRIARRKQGPSGRPSARKRPGGAFAAGFRVEAAREESAASVTSTFAPNMIGDMGGGPLLHARIGRFGTQAAFINLDVPSPSAGILGSQRFADNDCTLPTDRVFFDASYFHEAELAAPMDASRFVPGFEKTFLCGHMSVEMRFPMGDLESDNLTANSTTFGNTGQFGDIQILLKAILLQGDTWTLGTGLDISVPTAPGLTIENPFGSPLMQIDNSSTHLLPYVALLVNPNDDWFVQACCSSTWPPTAIRSPRIWRATA